MIDPVEQTLALWRSTPFVWGESDCMLSIGDYIASRGGRDVSPAFRSRYSDMAGAMRFMRGYGGAPGFIAMTGIERIDGAPERGDVVALTVSADEGGTIGALCTGGMIASRLERGVVEVANRFVTIKGVWRCPH